MNNTESMAWPITRLPEAIEVLARHAGIQVTGNSSAPVSPFDEYSDQDRFESWLDWACTRVGIEMEPVETSGVDFVRLLRGAGPALVRYRHAGAPSVLLLLSATAKHVRLIRPDHRVQTYPLAIIQAALWGDIEGPVMAEVDILIEQAKIPEKNRCKVARLLVQERMAGQRFDGCWMLRVPPMRSFWLQLVVGRFPHRAEVMLTVFGGLYLLEIIGWMVIGRGALDGRLDYGWLLAWVLLLLGMIPIQLMGTWLQGLFAIDFGGLLKQRLLAGALHMNLDEVRQKGVGQLLGHVIESQALESLALNGGFSVLLAAIELSLAAWVLAWGAGGLWHVLSLVLWIGGTLSVCWFYYQRLQHWTQARIDLTHELIEQMVGHRTRLAQEAPDERHVAEDQKLERYLHGSTDCDKAFIPLAWAVPRGWLIVGVFGLVPAFLGGRLEVTGLAVSLGGVLLAYRAFGEIGTGLVALARAFVAWETIAPLFHATQGDTEANTSASPEYYLLRRPEECTVGQVVFQARDVIYRYGRKGEPILNGCNLTICHGDRLLLEGASGGGKSTLAALLAGLRKPDSGLVMLNGLDQATLGQDWRRLSTAASQFHENYVLTGTFAFNLLMGRRWPPTIEDMAEAKQLCEELGLGDLLTRMPSGLMQMVGETGWQLSHGERSRLFLARALLQKAELVVLDESFAALDPETLTQCLRCALARAQTLVVIAHP